jgi:hypothetical protein
VRIKQTPRTVAPVAVPHALTTGPSRAGRRWAGGPAAPGGELVGPERDAVSPGSDGLPYAAADAPPGAPGELPPAGAPDGGFAPAPPIAPAMVYAVNLAPPPAGAYGPPVRPPHRDTALRTPLGWQTAALPGRRRSWLIGGAVVGTLSIAAATVLTLTRGDGAPSSGDRIAISDPAAGVPGAAGAPSAPAPAIAPRPAIAPSPTGDPGPVIDAARPSAADEARAAATLPAAPAAAGGSQLGAPARGPRGDGRRPPPAPLRPRDRDLEPVPRAGNTAGGPDPAPRRIPGREPEVPEPDAAAPARPDTAAHEARPTRSEPPRGEGPPTGLSAAELGKLFDAVKTEIEQLPEASRRDMLDQLVMLNIMRAMRESQQARDDAAAQLWKLRHRMRDRKAGR